MAERIQSRGEPLPPRHTERLGMHADSNDVGRKLADVFNPPKVVPIRRELPDIAPDAKSTETVICKHHWIVGPPLGENYRASGSCKKCGETREFVQKSSEPYGSQNKSPAPQPTEEILVD
jgi:hypothetical protein